MKSLKNFKSGQYAAVLAFVVVAGICAVTVAYNKKPNTDGKKPEVQESQRLTTEPVLTNKNNKPEIKQPENTEPVQQSAELKTEPENTVALAEPDDDFEITLGWPVEGDILLGFSPDTLVYDPTLDQYRTNDSVYIGAAEGTNVQASADGTVKEVVNDETVGNFVVVEHENGWATTYSQLADIKVSAGDNVAAGDVLGVVAKPSVYSSAMDSHVEFMVTLDDMAVNPETAIG